MYQNISDIETPTQHSVRKIELPSRWRSFMWALAAIALLLFPLFMMSSLTQAATDVSGDPFPLRECSVINRINKVTNNDMVARFDALNQSGDPDPTYFTGVGMKWVESSDGSARLTGDMTAIGDPLNSGFTVDVTFSDKAIANGNLEYNSFFGTLTGFNGYADAVVTVQPSVKAPSFRFWNNGPDGDGWIQWVVDSQSTGGQQLIEVGQSGVWSFSLNPNCKALPAPTFTPEPANGMIGNVVFKDNNLNGIQDADDEGEPGIEVLLWTDDDNDGTPDTVIATQTTDGNGMYQFQGLSSSIVYFVQFIIPADAEKLFTTQDMGSDDGVDSDPDPATGITGPITVTQGEKNDTVDAGVVNSPASIGDRVWRDINRNGIQDADEPGEDGVTVYLLDGDKNILESTSTSNGGFYSFSNLDPKVVYRVRFEAPANTGFTSQNAGGNDGADSDPDPVTGQTDPITLTPGENNDDIDAGLVNRMGRLGDTIFKDDNQNGIQESDEVGVAGVTVRLLTLDGILVGTTTTDADGQYLFSVDPKQSYIIEVVAPDGLNFAPQDAPGSTDQNDSDVDPTTGQTDTITVGADETDDTIDAGLINEPGTIAGTAFKDNNQNGIQDAGDTPIDGLTVSLWIAGSSGNLFASTETDTNGDYVFTNVNPKLSYTIQFEVPDDKDVTQSNAGNDDTIDSDITAEGMTKEPITVGPNEEATDIDAGFVNRNASIGDTVFNDLDRDGIQDPGEPGEPNVTVELLAKDGTVVDTTTTDSDGNYLFTDVDPKEGYIIRFTAPAGMGFTIQDAGDDDTADSDAGPDGTTDNITVDADEDDPTVDAGLVTALGSISGTVTKDDEPDGPVGEPGVTVELQDKAGTVLETTVTGVDGTYIFPGLEPGSDFVVVIIAPDDKNFASGDGTSGSLTVAPGDKTTFNQGLVNKPATIGDLVFQDINQNGIQDAGEPGAADVTVNLMDAGKTVLETTTTDEDGLYSFTVDPKGGEYIIQFVLPAGKEFTIPDAGSDDAADSDVTDPVSGQTDPVIVGADETNPTIDAGLVNQGASVGNFVFRDLDNDGIQDAGEPGVAGVTVILLTKDGDEVATTTTAADGSYAFIDIDPKVGYVVQFVAPDGEKGFTTPDVGADDTIDSDAGPDGTTDGSIDIEAGEDNPTVDAGLQTTFDLALRKTVNEASKLVLDGDTVVFGIEVCNQGNVPAADILIVDYIPGAFTLNDAAWTQVGTQAELTIAGPLAPGACTTVEISLIAAFSPARTFEFASNKAEIVQASDSAGNVRTSDVDSTFDRVELNDPIIDDEINLTPAGGDEDDHDKAIVQVLPRDLGTSGDVNGDGARTAVDALFVLQNDVGIAVLPISDPGRSGVGSQEEIDAWCGTIGAFSHNSSTVSGDFDGDGECNGMDYGDYVCDVSGDTQCNAVDALFILQCDIGLSNSVCPQ